MYLARIPETYKPDYETHQEIMTLYDGHTPTPQHQRNGSDILVLSHNAPPKEVQGVNISAFISTLKKCDTLPFSVRLTPIKVRSHRQAGQPSCYPIKPQEVTNWVKNLFNRNGFDAQFSFTSEDPKLINKPGHYHKAASIFCLGLLTITDVEKFKNALISGIGKDKAFGWGMVNVYYSLDV
jgi:CRISPR system Cascade subunit CasE